MTKIQPIVDSQSTEEIFMEDIAVWEAEIEYARTGQEWDAREVMAELRKSIQFSRER